MKRFLVIIARVVGFSIIGLIAWAFYYEHAWSVKEDISERVWIWGDSQTARAMDGDVFELEGITTHLDAAPGNGFIDLMNFSRRLPAESDVVIGLGPTFYRVNADRSQGGLSAEVVEVMREAQENEVIPFDFTQGLINNLQDIYSVSSSESNEFKLFPDQIDWKRRERYVSRFDSVVQVVDMEQVYLLKDRVLLSELANAQEKSARMTILVFPVCDELTASHFGSVNDHLLELIDQYVDRSGIEKESLLIPVDDDPFFDATHLKASAAEKVTLALSKHLKSDKRDHMLLIKFQENE